MYTDCSVEQFNSVNMILYAIVETIGSDCTRMFTQI